MFVSFLMDGNAFYIYSTIYGIYFLDLPIVDCFGAVLQRNRVELIYAVRHRETGQIPGPKPALVIAQRNRFDGNRPENLL